MLWPVACYENVDLLLLRTRRRRGRTRLTPKRSTQTSVITTQPPAPVIVTIHHRGLPPYSTSSSVCMPAR